MKKASTSAVPINLPLWVKVRSMNLKSLIRLRASQNDFSVYCLHLTECLSIRHKNAI